MPSLYRGCPCCTEDVLDVRRVQYCPPLSSSRPLQCRSRRSYYHCCPRPGAWPGPQTNPQSSTRRPQCPDGGGVRESLTGCIRIMSGQCVDVSPAKTSIIISNSKSLSKPLPVTHTCLGSPINTAPHHTHTLGVAHQNRSPSHTHTWGRPSTQLPVTHTHLGAPIKTAPRHTHTPGVAHQTQPRPLSRRRQGAEMGTDTVNRG